MKFINTRKFTWIICIIGFLLALVSIFFLPSIIPVHFANGSIILVDSLIFGYLFTNLSSTRSLCQRAVIYLTMLLYEKRHKFY